MAPPLAGRPPFATDEPDSIYETPAPIRRIRQPAPPNPNDRSSAYDMYDNYLNDPAKNRQSGAGALGLGLLNGSLDDEDDDDEPSPKRQPPQPQPTSKNAMLAAAVTGVGRRASPSPPPQYNASLRSNIPPPQPSNPVPPPTILALRPGIAAPRPGYAAPIAALNLARPEPAANPVMPMGGMPGYRQPGPPMMQNPFNPPLQNPFSPHPQQGRMQNPFQPPRPNYSSPSPMPVSSTPHPLEPPVTPITPVFARPAKEIKFDEKPIMRGKTEDTMLPSRGQRRDDFWRRFSMVVHEQERPNAQKRSDTNHFPNSMWLRRTQNGIKRMSRWVWLVGILLILVTAHSNF
ncbi:hypothetical protein VNI00_002716 [Paramarasmius palmivorus]|uniref:Uncharacterized protein n=1 Tax=Paramarasmius palmivorus TaxID=297713 RepID=A0AAW0DZV2_9AGAR